MSDLYTGLMVLVIFLIVATPKAFLLRRSAAIDPVHALRHAATREDAIRAAEVICRSNMVSLSDNSKVTACLGNGTYVLRSAPGKTVLMSRPQAENLIRASYGTPGLQRLCLMQLDVMTQKVTPHLTGRQWQPDTA